MHDAIIVPIHKKGNIKRCENFRGISILPTAYKILIYFLLKRLTPFAEEWLGDYQCGFRKGRSTTDQVFIVYIGIKHKDNMILLHVTK